MPDFGHKTRPKIRQLGREPTLLPWFGGTSAVWATCLLFFQVVLFGGYFYSHKISQSIRDRGEDAEILAQEFLQQFAVQCDKTGLRFGSDAIRAIRRHSWPGNVRELQNRVKRAIIMAEGKRVTAGDLELSDSAELVPAATLKKARENVERELVEQALKKHSGRVSAAATELGISRPTLYELMDKLGISRSDGAGQSAGEPRKETSAEPQKT